MSQQDTSPLKQPTGDIGELDIIDWKSFVQAVVEITVQAYQDMCKKVAVKLEWEEDHFTINLENCIRPIAYLRGLTVVSQIKTYTLEIEMGNVSAKQAKILDIRMWGQWENYHQVHFIWECKRVAYDYKDKKYKELVSEYITEGMFRFIDEEYASGLDDAGMLGYVLAGDVPVIAEQINRSMHASQRLRKLSEEDHLERTNPIGSFTDVYCSRHKRRSCERVIQLHHLLFTFDFSQ